MQDPKKPAISIPGRVSSLDLIHGGLPLMCSAASHDMFMLFLWDSILYPRVTL